MTKQLKDMSLKELWALFPIILTPHNEKWANWYKKEKEYLKNILNLKQIKISHIGSTAIKTIWAKPIIDILIEIPKNYSMDEIKNILIKHKYICMSEDKNRKSFNKGYTIKGFSKKVFHIHLRFKGDNKEIYFKNYLKTHYKKAKEYEQLKLSLWKKYEHNRDKYTNAKSQFVNEILKTKNYKK